MLMNYFYFPAGLNGNLGGLKFKIYHVSARTYNAGNNDIVNLDIPYDKIVFVSGVMYKGAVRFAIPRPPVSTGGATDNTWNIALAFNGNMLRMQCTASWQDYELSVVVCYTD